MPEAETLYEKLTGALERLARSEFGLDRSERRDIENSIDLLVTDGVDEYPELAANLSAFLGVTL